LAPSTVDPIVTSGYVSARNGRPWASRDGFGEEQPSSVDAAELPLNPRHVGMLALPTIDHQGAQFLRRRNGDGKTAALVWANDGGIHESNTSTSH
jgi:hypothetical protein